LKSTLLQLDSSFSERDYGVGSFREFAEKLARNGLVSLKHQGRSTLVELPDASTQQASAPEPASPRTSASDESKPESLTELLEQPDSVPQPNASLGDGVALVRRVLAEAATEPRWPMYPRQFKQFLRNAQPDFDERKYGSIADLMRACQKDGILRLERDRQGGLRVFAGGSPRAAVPHGWVSAHRENGSDLVEGPSGTNTAPPIVEVVPEVIAAPIVDAQITEVVEEDVEPKAKRAAKARKSAAKKRPASPRKSKAPKAP
jgi:hypothetical protein